MRLLLASNSTAPGGPYLGHALPHLGPFFGDAVRRVAFVPFAGVTTDYDAYTARVREAFAELGVEVEGVHEDRAIAVIDRADAVVVGGGNTFALVARLYEAGLVEPVRERVRAGLPYAGWSAGANVACPSLRTTNDMPVVQPPTFEALDLVPFQINPHYTPDRLPNHGGETRPMRLAEFCALEPEVSVVGLYEGSALRVEGAAVTLLGPHPLVLFQGANAPSEHAPGEGYDWLL